MLGVAHSAVCGRQRLPAKNGTVGFPMVGVKHLINQGQDSVGLAAPAWPSDHVAEHGTQRQQPNQRRRGHCHLDRSFPEGQQGGKTGRISPVASVLWAWWEGKKVLDCILRPACPKGQDTANCAIVISL